MKVAVVGAGAVGGVVTWHLAKAGTRPIVIARPSSARRLAHEGLTLQSPDGAETVQVSASSDPRGVGACELVLVGVKAHDWPAALPLIVPLIGPSTVVVPMLNGIPWWYFHGVNGPAAEQPVRAVDPEGAILSAIPADRTMGCVVYFAASRDTPTTILWNGDQRLLLGELSDGVSERLLRLVEYLRRVGLNAEPTHDIRRAVWNKMLGNVAHNPVSVITGATIGELAVRPHLNAIRRAVMEETAAVAAALGVGDFDIDARLKVPPSMMTFKTSMLQDLERDRPLELGAIVDAVIELGKLAGVATPVLATIGALALERSLRRSQQGSSSRSESM